MPKTVDYQPGFLESDNARHADPFWGMLKQGQIVTAYDGTIWTVVYGGLGGYGVIEDAHPDLAMVENDDLPKPTNWLREPYKGLEGRPLGEWVQVQETDEVSVRK